MRRSTSTVSAPRTSARSHAAATTRPSSWRSAAGSRSSCPTTAAGPRRRSPGAILGSRCRKARTRARSTGAPSRHRASRSAPRSCSRASRPCCSSRRGQAENVRAGLRGRRYFSMLRRIDRRGRRMKTDISRRAFQGAALLLATAFTLGAHAQSTQGAQGAAADAAAKRPAADALEPLPGRRRQAPELTRMQTVRLETTAGDVVIEVYPEAAPNAAARFVELVKTGFYDDTPISRVVPGFVAQFGINWREPHRAWQSRTFNDDPSLFALERGTLAFAKAGPDTNSTQVFINYRENNRLADPQYNFTVFGKVVSGMDVVDQFVQVGDPSNGLDQARLWRDGGAYLDSLPVKPTMIERAAVL